MHANAQMYTNVCAHKAHALLCVRLALRRGIMPRPGAALISTIRFLMTSAESFVTAETSLDGSNLICYWDLARAGGSEPVHVYRVSRCWCAERKWSELEFVNRVSRCMFTG